MTSILQRWRQRLATQSWLSAGALLFISSLVVNFTDPALVWRWMKRALSGGGRAPAQCSTGIRRGGSLPRHACPNA